MLLLKNKTAHQMAGSFEKILKQEPISSSEIL